MFFVSVSFFNILLKKSYFMAEDIHQQESKCLVFGEPGPYLAVLKAYSVV